MASAARQVRPCASAKAAGSVQGNGQHAGQKLRRFRQQSARRCSRVPVPHGLQRPLHRRHQVTRRVGQVGQPCGVGVTGHHDPREIAVIGARLQRFRAPAR
jgi:hypothetical protein